MINANESFLPRIVVSDGRCSKIIKINNSTNFEMFKEKIKNEFYLNDVSNMSLFYYELYSDEKKIIKNEEDYIIANKKGIEYLSFIMDSFGNYLDGTGDKIYDYLIYHSIIVFCH